MFVFVCVNVTYCVCVILASMSILPRYVHTCVMEFVYPLKESIAINDVSGSSFYEVFLVSPPPPMPTLSLYILTLEGDTLTSGVGWPKLSVLSLIFSVSVLTTLCYHEITSLTNRQTKSLRK